MHLHQISQWVVYHDQKHGFQEKNTFGVKKQISDCLGSGLESIECKGELWVI